MNKEAEESRKLCDQLFRALAPRPEDGLADWSIGPGYDGEPDLLVPSGRPCPCKGSGQFPDGLPCPVHSSMKTPAAGSDNPKANGTYPVYGNSAKNERESGI